MLGRGLLKLLSQFFDEQQRDIAERSYWQRQIGVAKWSNILTAIGSVIGLIGLLFVGLTLKEARESTVWANRAWIGLTGIERDKQTPSEDVGRVDPGAELPIRIYYDNVGKGPTLKVTAYFTPKIVAPVNGVAIGGINSSCVEGSGGNSSPRIVFQNSGKANWFLWSIPAKYITRDVITGGKDLIMQGCITYVTMNEAHQTRFCYVVLWDKKLSSLAYSPLCGDGQDAN